MSVVRWKKKKLREGQEKRRVKTGRVEQAVLQSSSGGVTSNEGWIEERFNKASQEAVDEHKPKEKDVEVQLSSYGDAERVREI